MRLRIALQSAMRTWRTRRIGLIEADRLVAGIPPGPEHRGLGVLLDAATAPPSVEELAGETAAVARFVATFRGPVAEPVTRNRVRVPRSAGMVAVKVAAGVAVLAAGGTAVAAETGNLPAGVRQFFSTLGAPAPDGGQHPTDTATGAGQARSGGPASPSPAPSRNAATTHPGPTAALALCRAWDEARTDPRGKAIPAESRRALAAAAGGEKKIAAFCDDLLAPSATPTASRPSTGNSAGGGQSSGSSTGPGSANGNGNAGGNGNGSGDGDGNKTGRGVPSPAPSAQNPQQP